MERHADSTQIMGEYLSTTALWWPWLSPDEGLESGSSGKTGLGDASEKRLFMGERSGSKVLLRHNSFEGSRVSVGFVVLAESHAHT